ncbi:MAG: YggS family pyridoxal phosphate-dependent enzyme [Methylophilaceae bacterium]|nr:YggS family pyridoxal phosphate-dependent enzyme [Methylophilaceae bacterium]
MNINAPIAQRLQEISLNIVRALKTAQRDDQILLVAVSKTQTPKAIREAFSAGQTVFGENYLQEALSKQQELTDLKLDWHFIGPIQSNKTSAIAENFSWVHGVDRFKIAQRLSTGRPDHLPTLNICIQINVSDEASKSGVRLQDALALAIEIKQLPHLKLRGLMTIPAPVTDKMIQHTQFKALKDCYVNLNNHGLMLDTLSMGMSDDYLIAIAEGATIVRVGSAIFGARN